MAHRSLLALAVALAVGTLAQPAHAQAGPKPEVAPAQLLKPEAAPAPEGQKADRSVAHAPGATLRVQLVISRFEGDRKVASLPYTLTVTADGRTTRMRMGVDTPIPAPLPGPDGKAIASYQYRNVGTNIDCSARDLHDGRYQLQISIENSSAVTGTGSSHEGMPLFRRFDTSLDPVLRDGQGVQAISSTDPVSGEVMKIDVTLNVVKCQARLDLGGAAAPGYRGCRDAPGSFTGCSPGS
jgi:hypothetical protein